MRKISSSGVHETSFQEQMKPNDDLEEESRTTSRPTIFGVALVGGIFLAATAFLAAAGLAFLFHDAPPTGIYQDIEYYLMCPSGRRVDGYMYMYTFPIFLSPGM
jgi:hypothetical protein